MDISEVISLLVWGMFVGTVFSALGAAGGILASFGLITIVGINDPNTVKPMAQIITLAIISIFLPAYVKRSACVIPVGLALSLGSVAGAWTGSTLSSHYLSNMAVFKPLFGVLALCIALQIFWKLFHSSRPEGETSVAFTGMGAVTMQRGGFEFLLNGQQFRIAFWFPVAAGFLIALFAAVFGVGGGFLLVPFIVYLLGMPMHVAPATAAIPIFIGSSVSVWNYLQLGAQPDYQILGFLVAGGMAGAILGPALNRMIHERWLQTGLGIIVAVIGVKYLWL